MAEWTTREQQPFVALVNNAGISSRGPVEVASMERLRQGIVATACAGTRLTRTVFEVNYFGLVALTQKCLPLLRASKGRIINVRSAGHGAARTLHVHCSSIAGVLAAGGYGQYASSKFAVEGFSDSLRKELRPLGVAVVLVNPAIVVSKIQEKIVQVLKGLSASDELVQLYARYIVGAEEKIARNTAKGDTTAVRQCTLPCSA